MIEICDSCTGYKKQVANLVGLLTKKHEAQMWQYLRTPELTDLTLEELGSEGWRMVSSYDGLYIFERPLQEDSKQELKTDGK